MKKAVFLFLILLGTALLSVACAAPDEAPSGNAADTQAPAAPAASETHAATEIPTASPAADLTAAQLSKLHFYLGGADHSDIESAEELTAAVEAARAWESEQGELSITIQFYSNVQADPDYKAVVEDRKNITTTEEGHAWRERLVEASSKYHQKLMAECVPLLSNMGFDQIKVMDLSPFAVITLAREDLTLDRIIDLAVSDKIGVISVGTDDMPIDADVTSDNYIE